MQTQAELNQYGVIIEQLMAETQASAVAWAQMGRKAQLEAWHNYTTLAPQLRVFEPFHRVLSALEEVV